MTDVNATLIPFAGPITNIMDTLRVLVGGVFGLYVILFIIKVREYFMLKKNLKVIRNDIEALSTKVDVLYACRPRKKRKKVKK